MVPFAENSLDFGPPCIKRLAKPPSRIWRAFRANIWHPLKRPDVITNTHSNVNDGWVWLGPKVICLLVTWPYLWGTSRFMRQNGWHCDGLGNVWSDLDCLRWRDDVSIHFLLTCQPLLDRYNRVRFTTRLQSNSHMALRNSLAEHRLFWTDIIGVISTTCHHWGYIYNLVMIAD